MAGGDFSHLVTNPKMKLVLSDCAHLNSTKLGKNYPLTTKYHGCCTSGPQTWYARAGIHLSFWGGGVPYTRDHKNYKGGTPVTVDMMVNSLKRCGMVPVWHGTGQQANAELNSSRMLRPGDVASMLSSNSAHGVMWTGEDWRSDAIQGTKPYCYSSVGRGNDWTFVLWRHPALQEPGQSVEGVGLGNMPTGPNMGGGGDTSAWRNAVDQMKTWYETNIHTYQKVWKEKCPLLGGGYVRDDCSGFVNACLCLYGLPTYDCKTGAEAPASYMMMQDDYAAKISSAFVRLPYSESALQPYDIMVGNAVNGNKRGHTEIYAGDRKSFSWGNVHDLKKGGMPSHTAWTFNKGTTYSYIFRCNGSGSSYSGGTINLSTDQLAKELADKCPGDIEFKGLWMRYHLFAGERSPVVKGIMDSHVVPGSFSGDPNSINGGPFTASAGDTGISEEMLQQICMWETGHQFGYTMPAKDLNGYDLGDAKGHRTFGYGLLYYPGGDFMDKIKSSWTQQELEKLFRLTMSKTSEIVKKWANKKNITLNQNQIDAMVSASFNFGAKFLERSVAQMVAKNPNDPNILNAWAHASDAQAKRFPGLVRRRQGEANWYFGKR